MKKLKQKNEDLMWENAIRQNETELLMESLPPTCSDIAGEPPLMRARDIAAMLTTLSELHKCRANEINFCFEAYTGDDGAISQDEILLVYRLEQLADGCITNRIIHTILVQIPQEVKLRARTMIAELTREKINPAKT